MGFTGCCNWVGEGCERPGGVGSMGRGEEATGLLVGGPLEMGGDCKAMSVVGRREVASRWLG